jgi:hypothetical protein
MSALPDVLLSELDSNCPPRYSKPSPEKDFTHLNVTVEQNTAEVENASPTAAFSLLMSPVTQRMSKFENSGIPIYAYDYDANKVLFSRFETPPALPASDHLGGGAPKGTLVKPNTDILRKDVKDIKHCGTEDIDLLSSTNWVIPRINDK